MDVEPQHLYEANKECEAIKEFRDDALLMKTTEGNVVPVLALNEVWSHVMLSDHITIISFSGVLRWNSFCKGISLGDNIR